jgi:hypothetical protein
MTASGTSRSLNDGAIRKDAASNFHSGNVAPGGFVQHVFSSPAQSRPRTFCGVYHRAANLKTLSIMLSSA